MAWQFSAAPDTRSIDDVINYLQNKMNEIANQSADAEGRRRSATSKLVTSDQRDGNARGVVFYYEGEIPLVPISGVQWNSHTFSTFDKYVIELYQPMIDLLNSIDITLSINSHATMTNYQGGNATLTLWWPNQA